MNEELKKAESLIVEKFGPEILDRIKNACRLGMAMNKKFMKLENVTEDDLSEYNKLCCEIAEIIMAKKTKESDCTIEFVKETLELVDKCVSDPSDKSCKKCKYRDPDNAGKCVEKMLTDCKKSLDYMLKKDE